MKKTKLIFVLLFGLMASTAQADIFGLANGRTANMDNASKLSVEAGLNLKSGFNTFAGRVNFKVMPDLVVFGGLGRTNYLGLVSGTSYGFGAFYQLRSVQLLENTDVAVKASYHNGKFDDGVFCFGGCNYTASEIAIEALISGDQLGSSNLAWYANGGFHNTDRGFNIAIGGGIVGSLGFGEWYIGADIIDLFALVGGVRYNVF